MAAPGADAKPAKAAGARSAEALLQGVDARETLAKETAHGNRGLVRALQIIGMAGPFTTVDPWRLMDERGETFINAGGYAALPFGERYPPLTDFVARYLQQGDSPGLPQQAAGVWRAELEYRLVEKLASVAPSHADSRVFFSNSGTEAIESAIKFAGNYRRKAYRFINFSRAYHGKTLGALSLTPNRKYQKQLQRLPFDVVTLPYGDLQRFEESVRELGPDSIAAVAIEPVQGEAGVIVPEPAFLGGVDRLCKQHGILTIADEIQTGLGRLGHWFASVEWGGMDPDLVTLAKPLGGGLTAIGATIARRKVYDRMLAGMNAKLQSNTFGGNSLAMAIGLKSLDILESEDLVERAARLGAHGQQRLEKIAADHPDLFRAVRGKGMLFAAQFQPVSPHKEIYPLEELNAELTGMLAVRHWHKAGILGNFSLNSNRSLRLTPALNMPEELFDEMFDRLEAAAAETKSSWRMFLKTPGDIVAKLAKFALLS